MARNKVSREWNESLLTALYALISKRREVLSAQVIATTDIGKRFELEGIIKHLDIHSILTTKEKDLTPLINRRGAKPS